MAKKKKGKKPCKCKEHDQENYGLNYIVNIHIHQSGKPCGGPGQPACQ